MYLLVWINPQNYFIKLIALLIGCIVLGFGVYIEVLADVVMLPGEAFVRAIVQTWNTNFGTTKIIFNSSSHICFQKIIKMRFLNLKLLLLLKLQTTKMLSLSADNMAAAVMT